MTVTGQGLVEPLAGSANDQASDVPVDNVLDTSVLTPSARSFRPNANSGDTPSPTIRHILLAIAGEGGPQVLDRVKELRPFVTQAHDVLRERFESAGSAGDYLRGRARLADSAVIGLLQIASISSGMRGESMVAPLAVIAVGGYGRKELAPGSDLDFLFFLTESSRARTGGVAPAIEACISAVVASLWDLGFVVDHAARSVSECLELAKDDATVLAGLVDRRFLWGGFGLVRSLDTDVTALLSGPDAKRWRDAVGDALSSAHRFAPLEMRALDAELDLKRGPGGLRDLQRAIWAHTSASGRPMPLTQASLVEAHRFLWLVRCHLHLLAGRADDRLSLSLQPGIACRLGLDAPRKPTAPLLLDLFRYHRRNVLAAAGVTPRAPESEILPVIAGQLVAADCASVRTAL